MPRIFTRAELTSTITLADYDALSTVDKRAFDSQLVQLWVADSAAADARYVSGDYDHIGSYRRSEYGA